MEKIKTLNKKHELILEQFSRCVDRFIFDITDDQMVNVFKNFIPLKHKASLLHNTIGKDIETDSRISKSEWVFMFPNLLMFGSFGFALALKTEENEEDIEFHVRELFDEMTETIHDLDDMLNDHFIDLEAKETLEEITEEKRILKKTQTK
tara:strand:+ start:25155 stop:25604 length:450 start_codon:yes stop_codon:yes gene_type:complete